LIATGRTPLNVTVAEASPARLVDGLTVAAAVSTSAIAGPPSAFSASTARWPTSGANGTARSVPLSVPLAASAT
jgi:hypothetical protein